MPSAASSEALTTFTRQLSILQDAGLPILRSLKILEEQQKPGRLKNSLMDTCDEIEAGSTLSEAMAKSPKAFDRLYVNMIKAGEAGGALETILKRLAEFQERSLSLRRKIKGALIYPIVVVMVAVVHLDLHHDLHRPPVHQDLRRFRRRAAPHDRDFGQYLLRLRSLLVGDSRHSNLDLADGQADAQIQGRPHGLGFVHHEDADLRPA